jgi:hypothetical protein
MAHLDQLHPRVQAVNPETGLLTRSFFRWLIQLYERTGGANDLIETANFDSSNMFYSESKISELEKELNSLMIESIGGHSSYFEFYNFKAKEISANYTTFRNEILICTSNITVTLNPRPEMSERVYIKRTNGKVTISGTIDGKTDLILTADNASVTLIFTQSGWWII